MTSSREENHNCLVTLVILCIATCIIFGVGLLALDRRLTNLQDKYFDLHSEIITLQTNVRVNDIKSEGFVTNNYLKCVLNDLGYEYTESAFIPGKWSVKKKCNPIVGGCS